MKKRMNKRQIFKLLAAWIVLLTISSCAEDIYGIGEAQGEKCVVSVNFNSVENKQVDVTRATDKENALNNLQVFVFDENGKLKGYKYIGDASQLKQDGSVGSVDIKTTTGNSYIYGVANVPTSIYKIGTNPDNKSIPTSVTDAESDEWDEDYVQDGKSSFKLSDLKSIPFIRESEQYNITDGKYMMSGVMNDGLPCNITQGNKVMPLNNDGSENTSAEPLIKLRRVVSKIKLTVKEGTGVSFTPTGYELRNIPRRGALVDNGDDVKVAPSDFETMSGVFDSQNTTNTTVDGDKVVTYMFEDISLPENRQNQNLKANTPTTWKEREADNGDHKADKVFSNAPENATYLVIKGEYDGPLSKTDQTSVAATVTYFIHLGDFSTGNYGDFNVDRNCTYTYAITISGVSDISVDVDKDQDGSGEGLVLNLKNGYVNYVDSHYAQADVTFNKSDVTTEYGEDGSEKQSFIYFIAKDIRGTTGVCRLVKTKAGAYSIERGSSSMWSTETLSQSYSTESWEPINADWVEFKEGSDQWYPGKGHSSLKRLVAVLKELIDNKDKTSFWTNGKKVYTCYINENYYEDRLWSDFVNTDSRYVYICRELKNSTDNRTINGAVIYGVSQNSIQTFYNLSEASLVNAYGCETDYDDNYACRSNNVGSKLSLSWGTKSTKSESDWNGQLNTLAETKNNEIRKNGYSDGDRLWSRFKDTDYTGTMKYQWAQYACMSRNRDNNGDGKIDDDEVRWYAPTIKQYTGLFIGKDAINAEARLFNGNTKDISEDKSYGGNSWLHRLSPSIHYWSSYNESAFMYWAEEGMATSNKAPGKNSEDFAPWGIRCVRNLPKDKGTGTGEGATPAVYYTYNNKKFLLENMNTNAVRKSVQDDELNPHEEAGTSSYNNMPALSFVVASNLSVATTMKNATTDAQTVCSQYTEDGFKWRAPNLAELALIFIATGAKAADSNSYLACRTKFSNPDFRYSWVIDDANQVSMRAKSSWAENAYIRCVRDVK